MTRKFLPPSKRQRFAKWPIAGRYLGGLLDGPLAFDNAIEPEAARIKGIRSEVAGRAQILVVPDLEAGNMLAKNLIFLAKADAAGLVLGARVPVILTSPRRFTGIGSCAAAVPWPAAGDGGTAKCPLFTQSGNFGRRGDSV